MVLSYLSLNKIKIRIICKKDCLCWVKVEGGWQAVAHFQEQEVYNWVYVYSKELTNWLQYFAHDGHRTVYWPFSFGSKFLHTEAVLSLNLSIRIACISDLMTLFPVIYFNFLHGTCHPYKWLEYIWVQSSLPPPYLLGIHSRPPVNA